jgi:hypothetical protein
MMRNDLAIIAGVISVLSAFPYIIDTIKGKTHPNLVSWFTWTLLNGINAAAAWSSGAMQTAIFSIAAGIATGAILLVGLRSGVKRYGKFDITCQSTALFGTVLWRVTNNPNLAVLVNLGTDFAGFLPTYRHALKSPHAETWEMFAISAFSAVLALASIEHFTFIALASPLYIFSANIALVITILGMRRKSSQLLPENA